MEITDNLDPKKFGNFMIMYTEFLKDYFTVFPSDTKHPDIATILENTNDENCNKRIYKHCAELYPKHFMNILYKNNEIFKTGEEFILGVDMSVLWEDYNENTKECIWKHIQSILFTIIETQTNKKLLQDSSNISNIMEQPNLLKDITKTVNDLEKSVKTNKNDYTQNPEEYFAKISDSKIGSIAKEIAEDTISNNGPNVENMMKDSSQMINLIKNIGSKLETKIESGELNEKELVEEAFGLMGSMQNMPGMPNIAELFTSISKNNKTTERLRKQHRSKYGKKN